jgi:hypothetical protein
MMWPNLLIDRFGCHAHRESRETTHMGRVVHGVHMHFAKMTMEAFASIFANQLRKAVTDVTGLKSQYEITLVWGPDSELPGFAVPAFTFFLHVRFE